MPHTPGPWQVHHRHSQSGNKGNAIDGLGWDFVDGKGPEEACTRGLFSKEADARLIAAAPEMYEMLKTTAKNIRSLREAKVCNTYDNWLEHVEAVIAKAEGK